MLRSSSTIYTSFCLLSLQWSPVYPSIQPSKQVPEVPSHMLFLQYSLHGASQFGPYKPALHSALIKSLPFFNQLSFYNLFIIH